MKKRLEKALQLVIVVVVFTFFSGVSLAALDTDNDGISDQWELTYQLNNRNPNDALLDTDSDGVANLFEFFIGTSPQDKAAPVVVTVGRSLAADYRHLEDAILMADPGTLIKVQTGVYSVNYQNYDEPSTKKVFIQGGWDETFTTRKANPYLTKLSGAGNHAITEVFLRETNQCFIFDCLSFEKGLAEYGVLNFSYVDSVASLVFSNCVIRDNVVTRNFGSIVRPEGVTNFLLINTIVSGNVGTGVYEIGTEFGGMSRVSNSTITANSNYGYRSWVSYPVLDIKNSIIWGNTVLDIYLEHVTALSDYSDIGNAKLRWKSLGKYTPGGHDISADPLFANLAMRNFTLQAGSPCIDTGIKKGAPRKDFQGQSRNLLVDIGADEYKGR